MDVLASVLSSFDQTWDQLRRRLRGLGDEEYLWEPVPGCWSVRPGPGGPLADGPAVDDESDPDPAPVTTLAWRTWHVAVDALDSYSAGAFGAGGTGLAGRSWLLGADEAVTLLTEAVRVFRRHVAALDVDGLDRALGPRFGSFADRSHLDLLLHAHRELTHHGAEIALLRDLWGAGGPGQRGAPQPPGTTRSTSR